MCCSYVVTFFFFLVVDNVNVFFIKKQQQQNQLRGALNKYMKINTKNKQIHQHVYNEHNKILFKLSQKSGFL